MPATMDVGQLNCYLILIRYAYLPDVIFKDDEAFGTCKIASAKILIGISSPQDLSDSSAVISFINSVFSSSCGTSGISFFIGNSIIYLLHGNVNYPLENYLIHSFFECSYKY